MANPNIVTTTSILGKTLGYPVTTTLSQIGVTNASGSNSLYKIDSIICSNIDGTNSADISISIYKNQSTDYYIARYIAVPPKSTLVITDRSSNPFYLEENDSIRAQASSDSRLHLIVSYEIIS